VTRERQGIKRLERSEGFGNRTEVGGRGSAELVYTMNLWNQYTQRTVAGAIDVFGLADPQVAVQVNGATTSRYGSYFHQVVSIDNSASAQYPTLTIQAGNNSAARHAFVPKNPEVFEYDADGNLTQDGRWVYEWNGENRLTRMTARSDVPGPHYQLTFQYDWMGRRIRKTVVDTDTGQTISDLIFFYDGWNLIAEVNAQTGELVRTYVWGLDLSGTFQGAGGIGGLLWVNVESGFHAGRYFVAYDGNGNVMGLVSASDGSVAAQYEYGPFAEPLRATGPLAADNPFRFSTKYTDPETGLIYYGYRYYDPITGRWLNRDPLDNYSNTKLYLWVQNSGVNQIDLLGCLTRWYTYLVPADAYGLVVSYMTFSYTFLPTPLTIGGGASIEVVYDCYDGSAEAFSSAYIGIGVAYGSLPIGISIGKGINFIFNLPTATAYKGTFVGVVGGGTVGPAGAYGNVFTTPQGLLNFIKTKSFGSEPWGFGGGWMMDIPSIGLLFQGEYFWDLGRAPFSARARRLVCRCVSSRGSDSGTHNANFRQTIYSMAKKAAERYKDVVKLRIKLEAIQPRILLTEGVEKAIGWAEWIDLW